MRGVGSIRLKLAWAVGLSRFGPLADFNGNKTPWPFLGRSV